MTELKALQGVEIKDASTGSVQAVFSTYNVEDFDGDVTLPGAFDDGAPVRISAFGHASWGPSRGGSSVPLPPVGKGVVRTTDSEAILDGQFFLKTAGGRDTFELVREMGDLQEWSYGYDVVDADHGDFAGKQVRFLRKLKAHEVSPVLLGAGVGTRTIDVKTNVSLGEAIANATKQAMKQAMKQAIAFKSTPTSDRAWDGPENKARLRNDGSAAYYRQAFAWLDPDADPETKVAYKFIHHEVDGDGNIGAASVGACTTGIAVLNGGRTGTTIPEADRKGVWNHLAGHLRDAGREPPPLKQQNLTFPEECEYVLGGVHELFDRVQGWGLDSDTKAGRQLSSANRERIGQVMQSMRDLMSEMDQMLADNDPQKHLKELESQFLRFELLRSNL